MMDTVKVAVVGAGPSGLSAIRFLREEGFDVACFEQKPSPGGVWTGSDDARYTAALKTTVFGINKFGCSMSDYPISKDCPMFPTGLALDTHCRGYAKHHGLDAHIQYNTTITKISRHPTEDKWNLQIKGSSGDQEIAFDKVLVANGIQNKAVFPSCPGIESFSGVTMHSQAFKYSEDQRKQFQDKRVLLVGLGNSSADLCAELASTTSKIHLAHRRGRKVLSKYGDDGLPVDIVMTWPVCQAKYFMDWKFPSFTWWAMDQFMTAQTIASAARGEQGATLAEKKKNAEKKLRGEWKILPAPSMKQINPVASESIYDSLRQGDVTLVSGFKGFQGCNTVLLDDGTQLDVDVVIFCTGYRADWSLFPELPMNGAAGVPLIAAGDVGSVDPSKEPLLPRLYENIFPAQWGTSLAFSSYNHPQENNIATQELVSMAVAQVWAADAASKLSKQPVLPSGYRQPARLPSVHEMDQAIDEWQTWWRTNWKIDQGMLDAFTPGYGFYRFLHETAGTGMFENMGHLFEVHKGWGLWWNDKDLYTWMSKGPNTTIAFRVFDTNPLRIPGCGRSTWSGARDALRAIYEEVEDYKKSVAAKKVKQS